jgi:hypothetical protein
MNFDTLNTKQQDFIINLYTGICKEEGSNMQILDSYPRAWLKMMSAKYCGMEWAPAWIVKDKSRQVGKGSYTLPELKEYHKMCLIDKEDLRDELPTDDGETVIIGTEVVAA